MKRFRISVKGIMSDVFLPKVSSSKSALYYYGFPATIGSNELTDLLVLNDVGVIQPHYPGTYDSDGAFTPKNAIKMSKNICEGLNKKIVNLKTGKPVTLSKVKIIFANSFGCFIALKSIKYFPELEYLFLFAPAITYGNAETSSG